MNAMNERIARLGVVPVIKLNHPDRDAANLARALCAGGVPVAEVTYRAEGANRAIRIMKETCPEMLAGAGTVTNTDQIDAVIAVGGEVYSSVQSVKNGIESVKKNAPEGMENASELFFQTVMDISKCLQFQELTSAETKNVYKKADFSKH